MATTKRKTRKKTSRKTASKTTTAKRKPRRKKKITARVSGKPIDVTASDTKVNSIEMQGDRLVVRISRESHPEIFDIDRIIKALVEVQENYSGKRKMRDICEFLAETEKSLQIIMSNHLEDALRKYLK